MIVITHDTAWDGCQEHPTGSQYWSRWGFQYTLLCLATVYQGEFVMKSPIFNLEGPIWARASIRHVTQIVQRFHPGAKLQVRSEGHHYTSKNGDVIAEVWLSDSDLNYHFIIKEKTTGDIVVVLIGGLVNTVWVRGIHAPNVEVLDLDEPEVATDEELEEYDAVIRRADIVGADPEFVEVY